MAAVFVLFVQYAHERKGTAANDRQIGLIGKNTVIIGQNFRNQATNLNKK